MSKTLIIGDLHIGKSCSIGRPGIGSLLNSRIIDQFNILEWLLARSIEFDAANIIITGDCFDDPKPHPQLIAMFVSWLKKCTDNNIDVHVIVGNHDILRSGQFYISALDIISAADIDGVFVYKQMSTFHTNGVSFTLMPFRDRRSFNIDLNAAAVKLMQDKMPYELAGIDLSNAKIVVGHLAIEKSIPVGDEIDDMTNELFCPVSMFNGYDFSWFGHIHKQQVMSKHPYVAHIGSMDLSDFSESDQKKFIVVFDPDNSDSYKYLEIPTRPLNQISISVPADITNTTEYVVRNLKENNSSLSKSIVRLNISLEGSDMINVDRSIVEKCLTELGTFHVSRINEERKIASIKPIATADGINNTVNQSTAIKMYADANINDSMKNEFIKLASEIVKECA